jgi:hypothetical protein
MSEIRTLDDIFEMTTEPETLVDPSDLFYHEQSMTLAGMFRGAYKSLGSKDPLTVSLLDAYRATRRRIAEGDDGKRYGHAEAYAALRG